MGAFWVAGGVALPTFYAVAVGAVAGLAVLFLQRTQAPAGSEVPPVPGSRPLVLLAAVAVLVTLVAPMIFNGLPTLSPTGLPLHLVAGVLTKSNIAQIAYLLLSISVVFFLARARWAGPEIVGTAACLATLLSFWSWSHATFHMPFPEGYFDNSPAFTLQDRLPNGEPRVRGIFSEPSALGGTCLITISYACSRMRQVSGWRRAGLVVVLVVAGYLGSISTSTTFFIAGVALAVIAALVALVTFVLRRGPMSKVAATVLCLAAIAALWVLPWLANMLGQAVDDKVGSSSYAERSGADNYSYQLVWNTVGLGAGLGSNRASSFVASLLSTVGLLGAVLLAGAVWILVRDGYRFRSVRPVVWALVALLLTKVIAGPDLSDTSGIMWTSLGVLAHAVLRSRTPGPRARPGTVQWQAAPPSPVPLPAAAGAADRARTPRSVVDGR